LQSAIVLGISSIEGFINRKAELWNKKNPNEQLLDSKQNKVNLYDKIDVWVPKMAGGKKLSKSGTEWFHFKKLRDIRNDIAIHPKESGYSISLSDLAEEIDMFRTGIAKLLISLHLLFGEKIPGIIIRAAYAPDVEIIEEQIDMS